MSIDIDALHKEISELDIQIEKLTRLKNELQKQIASNFLNEGGLEILQSIAWECYSPDSRSLSVRFEDYISCQKLRDKLGLKEAWGYVLLNHEDGFSININDDDEVFLSLEEGFAIDILQRYNLKVCLDKNRNRIHFDKMQLLYKEEDLAKLEKFEIQREK